MFDDVVSDRAQRGAKPSGLVTCVRNGGNHQGQTELLCKSHALYTVHPDLLIVLLVHVDSPGGLENSLFLLELFFWKRRKSWNFRFCFEGFATHCSVYGHFLLVHGAGWFWGCTGWFNENHHTLVLSMMWIHGVKRQWWWSWWWWSSLLPPSLITTIKYMYIYILTYITTVTMIVIIRFPFDIASRDQSHGWKIHPSVRWVSQRTIHLHVAVRGFPVACHVWFPEGMILVVA